MSVSKLLYIKTLFQKFLKFILSTFSFYNSLSTYKLEIKPIFCDTDINMVQSNICRTFLTKN